MGIADAEVWRDIPGYEGLYRVSNHGNLISCARMCPHRFGERKVPAKILTPVRGRSDLSVGLNRDGVRETKSVGYWVLAAFKGLSDLTCVHRDGNPDNNYLGNLKWGTKSEVQLLLLQRGDVKFGESHPDSKISNQDVAEIKLSNLTNRTLADTYGLDQSTVGAIRRGVHRRFA